MIPVRNTALASVIIPCYNQAHFLDDAINSVVHQTYPHYEIIVINDGSSDNTEAVAAKYPMVKIIHQTNQGAAVARNKGLAASKGIYVVFLDADDRLVPEALQAGIDYLTLSPDCAFVTGHIKLIASDGTTLGVPWQPIVQKDHYLYLLRSNYIWTPGVAIYQRAIFDKTPAFDKSALGSADYELNIRIARQFPIGCHGRIILEYRQHGANMTGNPGYMLRSGIIVRRRQKKHVMKNSRFKEAWKAGMQVVQYDLGEQLLKEIAKPKKGRHIYEKIKLLLILFRYYPAGFKRWLKIQKQKRYIRSLIFFR